MSTISGISLKNFRSYSDSSFEFDPAVNIIVGPNASGKTNLAEAIYMLAGVVSWRVGYGDIINFGSPWSRLDGVFEDSFRILKITSNPPARQFEIDNQSFKRLTSSRVVPVCLFEPNHLQLLSGSPELRRNWLDNFSAQVIPVSSATQRNYSRALAQRNSLLKQQNISDKNLFTWNIRLAELAGQVVGCRLRIIEEINNQISDIYKSVAGSKDQIRLNYVSKQNIESYESDLLKRLEHSQEIEIARGFTLFGPHRDDIEFTINGQPANLSMSRGETRTLLLSLKIIEAQAIESAKNDKPIMILDDVFSELDGRRRRALINYLDKYQVFLTTTDADVVLQHFNKANIIPVENN